MKLALDPYLLRSTPLLALPGVVADLGYEWIELSPREDFTHFVLHPRANKEATKVKALWDFVAVGRGHDVSWWAGFIDALEKVDPGMAITIEHEDQELDQMEGLRFAAQTLLQAARER